MFLRLECNVWLVKFLFCLLIGSMFFRALHSAQCVFRLLPFSHNPRVEFWCRKICKVTTRLFFFPSELAVVGYGHHMKNFIGCCYLSSWIIVVIAVLTSRCIRNVLIFQPNFLRYLWHNACLSLITLLVIRRIAHFEFSLICNQSARLEFCLATTAVEHRETFLLEIKSRKLFFASSGCFSELRRSAVTRMFKLIQILLRSIVKISFNVLQITFSVFQ